ncbi:hypothetical protein EDB89DRAFT_1905703 [Lactarius sanguifluus]|nr:hypothetical protein EDB89DRAFT_1905703 [Lactarius sanguifluus]
MSKVSTITTGISGVAQGLLMATVATSVKPQATMQPRSTTTTGQMPIDHWHDNGEGGAIRMASVVVNFIHARVLIGASTRHVTRKTSQTRESTRLTERGTRDATPDATLPHSHRRGCTRAHRPVHEKGGARGGMPPHPGGAPFTREGAHEAPAPLRVAQRGRRGFRLPAFTAPTPRFRAP